LDDAIARVAAAREQGRRIAQLAVDLLDITRLQSHESARREAVELREVARAVAAEFEERAQAAAVWVAVQAGDDPCWALGDPGDRLAARRPDARLAAPRRGGPRCALRAAP